MRLVLGIVLGLALFFPGITVIQWLGEEVLGYKEMTVTDGCLALIIILLSVIVVMLIPRRRQKETRPRSSQPATSGLQAPTYPSEEKPPSRGIRRTYQRPKPPSRQQPPSRRRR